jgi:hypothetical protein
MTKPTINKAIKMGPASTAAILKAWYTNSIMTPLSMAAN